MAEVRSIRQDMNDGRDGRMLARVTAMPFGANTDDWEEIGWNGVNASQ